MIPFHSVRLGELFTHYGTLFLKQTDYTALKVGTLAVWKFDGSEACKI